MSSRQGVLLTGATGFLGQYVLRDLILQSHPVTVLIRDARSERAAERIARVIAFWAEQLGRKLPTPVVVSGDLGQTRVGLTAADRRWLGLHCQAVIHAAANLSFRPSPEGEPWRTNVEGTRSLLALCRDLGLSEWHHVSTAFTCGRRAGIITEDDGAGKPSFHNPYEESKWQAERMVRGTPGIHATIYRPSVIVGDSRTGHTTSFNGLYSFLELAVRLASVNAATGEARLPLRLPLSGAEVWNLVPVDWVSRAIVELMARPQWHGRTFHLVAREPVSTRLVRDVGSEVLNLTGVEFTGSEGVKHPSRLEQLFLEGIQEYWPYLGGNPVFAWANTSAALPDLPPPVVDRAMLERLIRFAAANRWGRARAKPPRGLLLPSPLGGEGPGARGPRQPLRDQLVPSTSRGCFPRRHAGRIWAGKRASTSRSASTCADRTAASGRARGGRASSLPHDGGWTQARP